VKVVYLSRTLDGARRVAKAVCPFQHTQSLHCLLMPSMILPCAYIHTGTQGHHDPPDDCPLRSTPQVDVVYLVDELNTDHAGTTLPYTGRTTPWVPGGTDHAGNPL